MNCSSDREKLLKFQTQSCSILNNISVISSKFINKFVEKCQYHYTLSDQSIPLVTVMSVFSLLTEQLWFKRHEQRRRQVLKELTAPIYILRIRPSIRHACSFMRELETVFSATFKKKSLAALSLLTI